jgi:hypothetical protein
MNSKDSTKQSSGSLKVEKNSRADWLKSLKKGRKIWVAWFCERENPELELYSVKLFSCGRTYAVFGRNAEYVIKTKNIFPSKEAAETFYAETMIAAIKKKRRKLFDELSKWATLQKKYESMMPNTDPIAEKATFANLPKLPKTWGTVNGQKF